MTSLKNCAAILVDNFDNIIFIFSPELLLVQVLKPLTMIPRTERKEEDERDIRPGEMEVMVTVTILQVLEEEAEVTVAETEEVMIGLEDQKGEVVPVVEEDLDLEEVVKIRDQDPVVLEEDIIDCTGTVDIE